MLMRLDYFKQIVDYQNQEIKRLNKKIEIVNCIQTNGTLINEEWCDFFKKNNFRVGVSIDGNYDTHSHGRGTTKSEFKKIMNSVKMLNKKEIDFSIICVVTDYLVGKEKEIFDFFVDNKIYSWAFLPMNYGDTNDCISPEDYGKFLTNMFCTWSKSNATCVKIREFDEYLRGFLGKNQLLCNHCNLCDCYLTITPCGDVYPCDAFPQKDIIKLGNVNEDSLNFLKRKNNQLFKDSNFQPMICKECEFYNICNGGCRFYRWINKQDFSLEQFYCKSFYMLFEAMSDALKQIE